MAVIKGYNGCVKWSDMTEIFSDYNTYSWTLDAVADVTDTTDFTSTGWRTFTASLKQWSGTIEVYIDETYVFQPSDVGSARELELYMSDSAASSLYLHGHAIMSGWHPSVSVDGVDTQTVDFQGTSDLWFVNA